MTGTPLPRHASASFADVLDDVLLLRVLRRSRLGERAALDDHVVLHVLDEQRGALRVQLEVGHVSSYCMNGSRRPATLVSKR